MKRIRLWVPESNLCADLSHTLRSAGYQPEVLAVDDGPTSLWHGGIEPTLIDVSDPDDLGNLRDLRRAAPHIRVLAIASDSERLAQAQRLGAEDTLRKPFDIDTLERSLARLSGSGGPAFGDTAFLSVDPRVCAMLDRLSRSALSDASLRIDGEGGTGKNRLARWIHQRSTRRLAPFVVLNCGGLEEEASEEELFGAPGANGRLHWAQGGTLVLDTIEELSLHLQKKLLDLFTASDAGEGHEGADALDVRLIVTSGTDLAREIAIGNFREDLFLRLDVFHESLPPLRDRPADIGVLGRFFLERFARSQGSEEAIFSEAVQERLALHPFRGNVLELRNLMQRASLFYGGREIDADALLDWSNSQVPTQESPGSVNLRDLERDAIARCLVSTEGNRKLAAEALGINVRTLRNKIRLYELG